MSLGRLKLASCGHTPTPYAGHCLDPHCPRYLGNCARHDLNEPALCSLKEPTTATPNRPTED